MKLLKRCFCFWMLGKVIDISISVYLIMSSTISQQSLSQYLQGKGFMGQLLYVVYILEMLVTEVYPGRLVMSKTFLRIFLGRRKGSAHENSANDTTLQSAFYERIDGEPLSKPGSSAASNTGVITQKRRGSISIGKVDELKLPGKPNFEKGNGFGSIYFTTFDGEHLRVRKIVIPNVSTFQLREIPEELKKWKKITSPCLENYQKEVHQQDEVFIISDANPELTNLRSVMGSSAMAKMDNHQKMEILSNIVKTMLQLDTLGDGYAHGHLCPANILV